MRSPPKRLRHALLCLLLPLLAGCLTHSHLVGGGPTGQAADSQRQYYIFFGLLPLNEVNVQRLASDLSSYEIRSEFSFTDFLLTPLLLPFTMTSRTVTVIR